MIRSEESIRKELKSIKSSMQKEIKKQGVEVNWFERELRDNYLHYLSTWEEALEWVLGERNV